MPSNLYNRTLRRVLKRPNPVTPAQFAFLQQQEKNRRQAGQASQALLQPQPAPEGREAHDQEWVNIPEEDTPDDDTILIQPPDSDIQDRHNAENNEEADILERLERAQYDRIRLEHSNRWKEQYIKMFPTYLRCRQATSDWGDGMNWNADHSLQCLCEASRQWRRCIDMVDIMTRRKVYVTFCECKSDLVRLVELGYMGGTPCHPNTAFSMRLLRFFHLIWKHGAVRIQGFVRALDEYLDAHNPLILTTRSQQPRDWRTPFSEALDAYRRIITMVREQEIQLMQLSPLDCLAANCPRCFGPPVTGTQENEPHVIVCLDGNFQHRRHLAASVSIPGYVPKTPELFLPMEQWKKMASKIRDDDNQPGEDEELDSPKHTCSEQHTAANDVRGKSHWSGCDDTGLLGMACRHDHVLQFINIVQSGEKSYYALALIEWILGLIAEGERKGQADKLGATSFQRDLFAVERQLNRLKFGTSVFHAYVHEWGCQLTYNPRLNEGWGLSDGEGLERIWSFLSPLVRPNRYATSEHRLDNLNLRALHHNETMKFNAASSMTTRLKDVHQRLDKANNCLAKIQAQHPTHTLEYTKAQWTRQREKQALIISETKADKREQIGVLIELEEDLLEARAKRPRMRTGAEKAELLNLPRSLVAMEQKVHDLAQELGSGEFLQLTGTSESRAKLLLTIRLSKSKLYEAKVGVVENHRRAALHTGNSDQAWYNQLRSKKKKILTKKYKKYHRHVSNYNRKHRPAVPIPNPAFNEIEAMSITDHFWDIGGLTHPNEPWASDKPTREAIRHFLIKRGAEEEVRRIAREVRQLVNWSIVYQDRINQIKRTWEGVEDYEKCEAHYIYVGLVKSVSRLWMSWANGLSGIFDLTLAYYHGNLDGDVLLMKRWIDMNTETSATWAEIVKLPSLIAEANDEELDQGNVDDDEM
ncbi:hypothetical protein DFH28DRAFT_1129505 [Melampsora americana]|nr:hypothetical protein DFH28DRAFT_1129505 [Melampsora americana]